jgi:CubicO group peptidase (beta-lactamase class C family)
MDPGMLEPVDRRARGSGFSGVVRVDAGDQTLFAGAYGLAHRGWQIPNRLDTRFQIASGAKGFTALAVASLVEDGQLRSTPRRGPSSAGICRSSTTA